MQRLVFSILISCFITSCSSFGQSADGPIGSALVDAKQAYFAAKHVRAYELFNKVWTSDSEAKLDQLEAGRYLAKMDWRLYGNLEKAYNMLTDLAKAGQEVSKAYTLRARVLASEEKFDEAISWSGKAIESSISEKELLGATLVHGANVLSKAKKEIFKSGQLSEKSISELNASYSKLQAQLAEKQDNFDLAKLHLGHALLLKKGAEVLSSWRLFYRLTETDQVHPSLLLEPKQFNAALNKLNKAEHNPVLINTIIKGLAESGFCEYAMLLKAVEFGSAPHPEDEIRQIEEYNNYLKRLGKTVKHYYEGLVTAETDLYKFQAEFEKVSRGLWEKLDWSGNKPEYSQSAFINAIRERFKGLILFNTVDGYYGIHVGQVILDDRRMISQYDQNAEFRYTLIEHVLSNGYITWHTDAENSVGGWASNNGSFVQVRTDLNSTITELWSMLKDPVESKKISEQIERMSQNEDEMARKNPYAYLPGLQYRLVLRESQEVIDSLERTGLDPQALRYAFISFMERIAQDAKIYAHEGRHSIDMKYKYTSGSANLEYTAKLSEVYFAEKPFFMMATLMSSNMGDGTAHGNANLKLVKELMKWMEAHQSDIDGFDPSKPTLPQIGKMTDSQLKTAIRSLDPVAN